MRKTMAEWVTNAFGKCSFLTYEIIILTLFQSAVIMKIFFLLKILALYCISCIPKVKSAAYLKWIIVCDFDFIFRRINNLLIKSQFDYKN